MSKKVLIFEADPAFAAELRDGLERIGCSTTVVDDVNSGMQLATSDRPDLILLAIELPRMNGFSVCNKLKRDPSLKEVPLLIMSSDSTEETFEQHRRLRTRAEDYVHKPIAFAELLTHISALVPLDAPADLAPDDDLVLEDIEIGDSDLDVTEASVDHEVEDFAEQAFDALLDEVADPSAPPPPPPPPPPTEAAAVEDVAAEDVAAEDVVDESDLRLESLPPAARSVATMAGGGSVDALSPEVEERLATTAAELSAATAELDRARTRIGTLEREVERLRSVAAAQAQATERASRLEQELSLAQREAEATKKKLEQAASGKSSTSAREFLDLREALNKKDKEILDLRDEITHRDKEILALRDSSLGLERAQADLTDRVAELERLLSEAQRQGDANRADKEQAAKRADDFKRRAEKLQADLEAKSKQLEEALATHAAELERHQTVAAETEAAHQAALARAAEERIAAVAAAEQQGQEALAQAVTAAQAEAGEAQAAALAQLRAEAEQTQQRAISAREQELRTDLDARLGALHRAHDDAMAKLRAEQEQATREASARSAALAADLERLTVEREALRQEVTTTSTAKAAVEAEREERTQERDAAYRTLEARDAALAELEARLAQLTAERDAQLAEKGATIGELEMRVTAEQARIARALAKWEADRASLASARDALATAMARIEETDSRSLD